jgi:hypothetical protein
MSNQRSRSSHRYEDIPRTLKLTGGVRLVDDRVAVGVEVFRGEVQIATEEVFLSVDDASVMNAQLTYLLNRRAYPGPGFEQAEQRRLSRYRSPA